MSTKQLVAGSLLADACRPTLSYFVGGKAVVEAIATRVRRYVFLSDAAAFVVLAGFVSFLLGATR